MLPLVSVVVPIRNESCLIPGCLTSLLKQDYPKDRTEIIAVDNGSTDDSGQVIRRYPVRCLFEAKVGAGAARNRGAREAQGELLAFVDADCELPSGWISRLVSVFEKEGGPRLAGGRTVSAGSSLIERFLDFRGRCFYTDRRSGQGRPPSLPWLITTNVMVRRELFEAAGGFEEALQPGEDADLSWRLLKAGVFPNFLPDLVVQERRKSSFVEFYIKNFRVGRSTYLLEQRYRGGPPARKRSSFLGSLLAELRRPFFFLTATGHIAFQTGKAFMRLKHQTLRKPLPVTVLSGRAASPILEACALKGEERLLYLAALSEEIQADPSFVREMVLEIKDWGHFLKEVFYHRLPSRVYAFLNRHQANSFLSPEVWEKVKQAHYAAQLSTMKLEAELLALLPLFNQEKIDVLLMKGAALLQTVYRDRPIRHFIDLDLLVRPEDFPRAKLLLEKLGYRADPPPRPFPSGWHERKVRERSPSTARNFSHARKGISVDLHQEPFEKASFLPLKAGWLWEGAREISVGEGKAFLPEPGRLFTHLFLHWVKHAGEGHTSLGWLADLDECLRAGLRTSFSGLNLSSSGLTGGSEKALSLWNSLETYFSSPLPVEIQAVLKKKGAKPLPIQELFAPARRPDVASFLAPGWLDRRQAVLLHLRSLHDWSEKALYLFRWLLPDRRYLETKYQTRSPAGTWLAYGRHLAATAAKGLNLGLYSMTHDARR